MVRSLNTIFFSHANADVGFCDADPTEFEGFMLLWPESEVGVEAVVQCPTTMGMATRVCESAGVWAAPDTTACINVPAVIGELTTMVSDKMCNGKSDVQWKITWRPCGFSYTFRKCMTSEQTCGAVLKDCSTTTCFVIAACLQASSSVGKQVLNS